MRHRRFKNQIGFLCTDEAMEMANRIANYYQISIAQFAREALDQRIEREIKDMEDSSPFKIDE